MKEALTHLLRAQYGESTPLIYPTAVVQVQSAEDFFTLTERQRGDKILPLPVTMIPLAAADSPKVAPYADVVIAHIPEPPTDTRRFNPCRHCGERYFACHRCRKELDEEGAPEEAIEEEQEGPAKTVEGEENQKLVRLSLQSMVGITAEKSMKMRGRIGEAEVIILIDSGATSNFISQRAAKEIKLHITATREFVVLVGDGKVVTSKGKCSGVTVAIQGVEIIEDFLLFELGSSDIVLRYTWLATLGETRINWGLHTLKFKVLTHWITLVGDPSLTKAQASLNSMGGPAAHLING